MLLVAVAAAVASLGLTITGVAAQGTSNVQCMSSFDWSNNTLHQNPCLVGAYLQAVCNDGSFSVNSIPAGFHYIGPTNDTSTQNPCICSTPVYQLISACGACQNLTWITWSSWSFFCPPSMLTIGEGVYPETIPAGTVVPHWAYIKPSDNNDDFDVSAAQLVGDSPESSQTVASSTTASSSTTALGATTTSGSVTVTIATSTSTSTSGGGGSSGHKSSNTGPIVGGAVGGVIGLGLLALLAVFLIKKKKKDNVRAQYAGSTVPPANVAPMSQHGGGGSYAGVPAQSPGPVGYGGYDAAAASGGYVGSHNTGQTHGYQPTVGSGGVQQQYYNPSDPSTYPASFPPSNGSSGGYGQPQPAYAAPAPQHAAGRYSGMPEV